MFHLRGFAKGLLKDLQDFLVGDLLLGLVFRHVNYGRLGKAREAILGDSYSISQFSIHPELQM